MQFDKSVREKKWIKTTRTKIRLKSIQSGLFYEQTIEAKRNERTKQPTAEFHLSAYFIRTLWTTFVDSSASRAERNILLSVVLVSNTHNIQHNTFALPTFIQTNCKTDQTAHIQVDYWTSTWIKVCCSITLLVCIYLPFSFCFFLILFYRWIFLFCYSVFRL